MASYLCWQQIANQGASQIDYGNVAQLASAVLTLFAIVLALFREPILSLFYKPKLELKIKACPPDCHKMRYGSGTVGYYCRFWVFNSGNRPAQDVQVYATSLKAKQDSGEGYSDVESFLPMNFKWSYSGSGSSIVTKSLSPSIGKHCDFGHIVASAGDIMFDKSMGGPGNLDFVLDLEFDASTKNFILKPGDYLLELIVAASNATSKRYSISFCYDGGWSNSESVMFSERFVITSVKRL